MTDELWDQTRIAAEFGVSLNAVQSLWRNATLKAVHAHLRTTGLAEHDIHVLRVERLTAQTWEVLRVQRGAPPLRLPRLALPLPDVLAGNRPQWRSDRLRRWAADTGRIGADGRLCRLSPPGRPVGIVETAPRRQRSATARPDEPAARGRRAGG